MQLWVGTRCFVLPVALSAAFADVGTHVGPPGLSPQDEKGKRTKNQVLS